MLKVNDMAKKAVILFSGGLDSTTCIAIAKSQGFDCYALSFDYSQRHASELEAAKRVAKIMGVKEHKILKIPGPEIGGSALTDLNISVPDYAKSTEIPVTYVPARNTIFLSFALGYAEVINAYDIFLGVSAIDYSNYPDCRPEYISAFEQVANLATKAQVERQKLTIHAPIIHLSKAETILEGLKLGVDYRNTVSCYSLDNECKACGRCDPCALRKKGFAEAEVADPTVYA